MILFSGWETLFRESPKSTIPSSTLLPKLRSNVPAAHRECTPTRKLVARLGINVSPTKSGLSSVPTEPFSIRRSSLAFGGLTSTAIQLRASSIWTKAFTPTREERPRDKCRNGDNRLLDPFNRDHQDRSPARSLSRDCRLLQQQDRVLNQGLNQQRPGLVLSPGLQQQDRVLNLSPGLPLQGLVLNPGLPLQGLSPGLRRQDHVLSPGLPLQGLVLNLSPGLPLPDRVLNPDRLGHLDQFHPDLHPPELFPSPSQHNPLGPWFIRPDPGLNRNRSPLVVLQLRLRKKAMNIPSPRPKFNWILLAGRGQQPAAQDRPRPLNPLYPSTALLVPVATASPRD